MVCVNPACGDQHPDVLSSDVYSLFDFQDVAVWLEASAGFAKRRYRVVEVGRVLLVDRCTDGLAREAEVQVVSLVLSCCEVCRHQVPQHMKNNSDLYASIFPIIKSQPQANKERANHIHDRAIPEVGKTENQRRADDSQKRASEEEIQSRQQVSSKDQFFGNAGGESGIDKQKRIGSEIAGHYFQKAARFFFMKRKTDG